MERTTHVPPPGARRKEPVATALVFIVVLAVAGGLLVAELAGRAPRAVRSRTPREAPAEPAAAPAAAPVFPAVRAAPATALATPAPAAIPAPPAAPQPLLTAQGRPTPALVTRVTEEAARSLEAARADLAARCPPDRARATPGRFTFNVVFDASGREIARGIAEDRRARAPEVAACLRGLPLGALHVSPPGASVGVRVALSLP